MRTPLFFLTSISLPTLLNLEAICFLAVGGLSIILIAILIATFCYEENRYRAIKKEIVDRSSSIRLFYISRPTNSVRYFNLSNMAEVKLSTLEGFYASFPISEQARLREWIESLFEGKEDVPQYLEVQVYFHKERRTMPSFLRVDSINKESGILHLQSYLLHFSRPTHSSLRSFNTVEDLSQALSQNNNKTGMTFCFVVSKPLSPLPGFDPALKENEVTKELSDRFRLALFPFTSHNDKVIRLSGNEIVVTNFDMIDASNAIFYALKVKDGVEKSLNGGKKGTKMRYEVRVGIVDNQDIQPDAVTLLEAARRSAYEAINKGKNPLSFYLKGQEHKAITPADELHYRSEVDRIIYEKKLSFSYRPIYAVQKKKIYGYMGRATPIGTSFASIDELKNYAIRAKDEKNLFAFIAKKIVPTFVSERMDKNHKLFYPCRMSEIPLITSFFPHYNAAKEANLIFLFKEEDIASSLDEEAMEGFNKFIASLKRNGFGFAIQMQGKSLALDNKLYSCADAFFVDFSLREDSNMDTSIRSELHALVEKLMRYKKPIVGINLMNWNAIELVVGSKLEYISSDCFAPYETMFKPLNSKNVERIKAMVNRK